MKALAILAVLFFAVAAQADIVGVDFNQTGAVVNQSGFNDFSAPGSGAANPTIQTFSTVAGNLTVTVGSVAVPSYTGNFNDGPQFVNSGAFTYSALMNDFAYSPFDPNPLNFQLSGPAIIANKTFPLTVWAVDSHPAGQNNTVTVSPTSGSGTTGTPGTIVDNGTLPTSNYSFSTTVFFTANSSGILSFSVLGAGNTSERVNGFELTVPEPTGAALLLSLIPVLSRRKRQARHTVA